MRRGWAHFNDSCRSRRRLWLSHRRRRRLEARLDHVTVLPGEIPVKELMKRSSADCLQSRIIGPI